MNKKIYAGMIAFGIAASFWACGSGEIMNPSENDKTMKEMTLLWVYFNASLIMFIQ